MASTDNYGAVAICISYVANAETLKTTGKRLKDDRKGFQCVLR